MTDYDIHRPSFSGTKKTEWEFPTEDQFNTDNPAEAADRFLLSASGFDDPDSFDDLQLPVVDSFGYLNINGLWAARSGPYSVERVEGIDEETKAALRELIDDLGTENFEEFQDVTVTESEWKETTRGRLANLLDGLVERLVRSAQPAYSAHGAVIGLVFLAGVALCHRQSRTHR
ncbi:MAG TPA: hypothetical protein VFJ06_04400 [Halococcus sp.]|nr:hypothetical protein [Halococcus sp.]